MSDATRATHNARLPVGPGAAAIFSAGLCVFALSLLAIAGDHSAAFRARLIFYRPTGPLSGVTTLAVLIWLATWAALDAAWRRSNNKSWAITAGLVLLALGFLLLFPLIGDIF